MRNLLLSILMICGMILQVFLSKKENKWLGLILPTITFLIGLLYPLSTAVPMSGITLEFILELLTVWVIGNIPTIIFLAIYFVCRKKMK